MHGTPAPTAELRTGCVSGYFFSILGTLRGAHPRNQQFYCEVLGRSTGQRPSTAPDREKAPGAQYVHAPLRSDTGQSLLSSTFAKLRCPRRTRFRGDLDGTRNVPHPSRGCTLAGSSVPSPPVGYGGQMFWRLQHACSYLGSLPLRSSRTRGGWRLQPQMRLCWRGCPQDGKYQGSFKPPRCFVAVQHQGRDGAFNHNVSC
jgi:hypothetical protein